MISPLIGPRDQLLDLLPYQDFDLSMGYRQVKSEPTMFVMFVLLVVDPSSIHHYIFWSDHCYHRVHMMVEVR